MNAEELIKKVYEDAFEWIEMSDDPYRVVSNVLANKIMSLNLQIEYLEKRLNNGYSRVGSRKQ